MEWLSFALIVGGMKERKRREERGEGRGGSERRG